MALTYKCPNCGDEMLYDSNEKKLVCNSCGTTKDIDAADKATVKKLKIDKDVNIFKCQSCGAELITDKVTTATFCNFCGNSNIIPSRLTNIYRPSKVIPFKFNKEQAQEAFKKWCKNGLVTPKDFNTADRLEKISGIYVPFWLYDCSTNADIKAMCTKVRVYVSGDTEYTETDHFIVHRNINANYLKVPADASEKMDNELMDKLEPYNYLELKDFKIPYLSGYQAEKYEYDSNEMFPRVKQRVDNYIRGYSRNTIIGYSTVAVTSQNTNIEELNADYVLLPVWILNYDYNGKKYTFAMNGQTGKVVGKVPISAFKVLTWGFIFFLIAFIISAIIGGFIL